MRWLVLAGSVVAYLLAAKVHGLQLRVERELAGHFHVVFGGTNPPFVDELWQRERVIYWGLAAALASAGVAYVFAARRFDWPLPLDRSRIGVVLLAAVWPMTAAFLLAGAVSALRSGAFGAGALWWVLAAGAVAAVAASAWIAWD